MEFRIDKRLTGFISILPLLFFAGISLYSFIPEIMPVNKKLWSALYWVNSDLFVSGILFALSRVVVPKKTKYILLGSFFFFILLGAFQVTYVFIDLPSWLWMMIFPLYLIPYLIIIKYVRG